MTMRDLAGLIVQGAACMASVIFVLCICAQIVTATYVSIRRQIRQANDGLTLPFDESA